MTYVIIILLAITVGLSVALYFQMKASRKQAEEQQQLLSDYQQRVDEQQKLLDDYRALEKNFDNIGEGYEQALMSFDKMQQESKQAKLLNETQEKRLATLQEQYNQLQTSAQRRAETIQQAMRDIEQIASSHGLPQLHTIIGHVSDLDDLPADQPPIERTDNVMVAQVADEAIRHSAIDQAKYISFQCIVADDAAVTMLSTNLKKAVRALTHLLDNAKKFTTEGAVTLSVAVDMSQMQAIYTVEDTGAGIEPAEQEHIFEPYVKLNQYFDGQGIGLTVARNVARRMGGDITLSPAATGTGSRFQLVLPI